MKATVAPPPLQGLVRTIWASPSEFAPGGRELVLPTGDIHLVLRLSDAPLRLVRSGPEPTVQVVSTAVIGGARSAAYCRETASECPAVGVLLAPGACRAIVGISASEISERHIALEDIWPGARIGKMRERLAAVEISARPALMASMLAAVAVGREPDSLVMAGLGELQRSGSVAGAAACVGLSRRHFARLFLEEVGLSPRNWLRTRRFSRLLDKLHDTSVPLAELATATGFADQSHMSREFARMAGVTPGAFRRLSPKVARHVPLPFGMSHLFKTGQQRIC